MGITHHCPHSRMGSLDCPLKKGAPIEVPLRVGRETKGKRGKGVTIIPELGTLVVTNQRRSEPKSPPRVRRG